MSLSELLTCQRRWGRTRARKFLQGLGLSENKRLETLTQRQRALLLSELTNKDSRCDRPARLSSELGRFGWASLAEASELERKPSGGPLEGAA